MGSARLLKATRRRAMWVTTIVAVLLLGVPPLASWNQNSHRQVNYEATKVFFARAAKEQKFQLGPISEAGRNTLHRGIAVASATLFVKPVAGPFGSYQLAEERHTMEAWISLGGDWADEPNLYASVRHFYDPLQADGVAYLTDQYWAHGIFYDSPAIDAVTWALEHPDNPFCLKAGMVAYKHALETPEDLPPPPATAATHFKTNLKLTAKDAAEQRSLYLAHAYRALGEAMHMIGDMTQPAHVRNDSHPLDEPIEGATYSSHVRLAAAHPLVDSRAQSFLASAGGSLQTPRSLSHQLALFTNRNLYSMDTIFDQPSGTMPNNNLPTYPLPQFSSLTAHPATIRGFVGKRKVTRLFAKIAGREVPVAQERLSFHWFDPDHSLIFGPKLETVGRASSIRYHLGPYMIPSAFAREQAAVLLPIAIHGSADLMDLFFPTLELEASYRDDGLQAGTAAAAGSQRQVITIEPSMVHHKKRDPAWKAFDLTIEYSGPGTLVITRGDKVEATRKLQFKDGRLTKIESSAGKMIEAPLQVFVAAGGSSLSEEEAFYAFAFGQKLHLEIDAGSRHFESPSYELKPELLTTPRIAIGPPGATFDFDAHAQPEGIYRFEWSWPGMDGPVASEGSSSSVAPVLTEEGEYLFTVKLIDADGTVLAEDRVSATVEKDEEDTEELPSPSPMPRPTAREERKDFKIKEVYLTLSPGVMHFSGSALFSVERGGIIQGWVTDVETNNGSWQWAFGPSTFDYTIATVGDSIQLSWKFEKADSLGTITNEEHTEMDIVFSTDRKMVRTAHLEKKYYGLNFNTGTMDYYKTERFELHDIPYQPDDMAEAQGIYGYKLESQGTQTIESHVSELFVECLSDDGPDENSTLRSVDWERGDIYIHVDGWGDFFPRD